MKIMKAMKVCQFPVLCSNYLPQMCSFSVIMLWITCADSHPKGVQKDTLDINTGQKTGHNSLKKCTFEA